MSEKCNFCKAIRFRNESVGLCCGKGKVHLERTFYPPEPMYLDLYEGKEFNRNSGDFLKNIRSYNNSFAMTSFGVGGEPNESFEQRHNRVDHSWSTFKIRGQVYHRIGSLQPGPEEPPRYLQVYFTGSEDEQADIRCDRNRSLNRNIVILFQELLHAKNELIRYFKTALEMMPGDEHALRFSSRDFAGIHPGRLNVPSVDDVAVIMVTGERDQRDVLLVPRRVGPGQRRFERIMEMDPRYDALQYPLILWEGQYTFHYKTFKEVNPVTRLPTNKFVSTMDYYAYHFMIRGFDEETFARDSFILLCRGLLNQFAVDMYAKVEAERLRYIRMHQSQLRRDDYINLRDAMLNDGNALNAGVPAVILPATFMGSPRHMQEYAQDAVTYVTLYGKPDFFITFTCNPNWHEIELYLYETQKSNHRHDLVARVFRQKHLSMIKVLTSGELFGKVRAHLYSIEWQKRGLPHSHTLIWLTQRLRPNQVDQVISAEIPDPNIDPQLYRIVTSHMVHGPCGILNRRSPCMDERRSICTKNYPRHFLTETTMAEDGYPQYRRRAPADGGREFVKRVPLSGAGDERLGEFTFDNRWIVPHNPVLSRMFDAHINVEYCHSVKSIKYICKYVCKGPDMIQVQTVRVPGNAPQAPVEIDEVTDYELGRYISSNESFWRLFNFKIHDRDPAIERLVVHGPAGQRVYFNPNDPNNVNQIIENPMNSTLTALFELCQNNEFARTLIYPDVPRYFTWDRSRGQRFWKPRRIGVDVPGWPGVKMYTTVGRVYTVHPTKTDEFHIRLLLHHVKGPTSFESLRTLDDGTICQTYRDACIRRGLLESDSQWISCLQDAVATRSSPAIRLLFAIILTHCNPGDPASLWNRFKSFMLDDYLREYRHALDGDQLNERAENQALQYIEDIVLRMSGRLLRSLGMPSPNREARDILNHDVLRERNYNTEDMRAYVSANRDRLVDDQKIAYYAVGRAIQEGGNNVFFIDAPGGTGKTFLLNLLLARVRQSGDIAIATATSGLAAILLEGGRTAHSTFKLSLNIFEPMCSIARGTSKAAMLIQAKLIVWDECTMAHRVCFEALDRCLKDLTRCEDKPFGGKVIVFAGDFRQTLPIVPRGTPADEINASLKKSYLWRFVQKFNLRTNMRVVARGGAPNSDPFSNFLLEIGEGRYPLANLAFSTIQLTREFCNLVSNETELIERVFPNIAMNCNNSDWLCQRAILATTNEAIDELNLKIQALTCPRQERTYLSVDSMPSLEDTVNYPIEFLNSLTPSGMPAHRLHLRLGSPIMLLRNLDPPKLVNGTKLCITALRPYHIGARIMLGPFKGEDILLPRIPFNPSDNECLINFKRLQFPVRLAFAMTINKSQGQSLQEVGIHLERPVFSHGQLYVALSRVGSPSSLHVLAPLGQSSNIVYLQALR